MSFLQVRPYIFFTSSTFCPSYKFDLMLFYQVWPDAFFKISTLCPYYRFDLMSILQVRPYVLFTSSTLCPFYKLDLLSFYKFDLIHFYKYDIMSISQVQLYVPFMFDLMLFLKFRHYVLFTRLTLCPFCRPILYENVLDNKDNWLSISGYIFQFGNKWLIFCSCILYQ